MCSFGVYVISKLLIMLLNTFLIVANMSFELH